MNITNAQFTAEGSITALVDGVQMSIPADADNRHYAAMLEQGIEIVEYVEPPAPVPDTMTFAQLLNGLVTEGWITEDEGDSWLEGKRPAAVNALIAQLPKEMRFLAKARATIPSTVERNNDLVIALAQAENKTPEELDAFFEKYAAV